MSILVHERHSNPSWATTRTVALFSLFTCLYALTLFFSDSLELSFLGYVAGLLALVAVFRFGGLRTVLGFLVTVFVARYYFSPLLVKAIEGRPIWHNLYSPTETLLVLTCSLLALVSASVFLREKELISERTRTLSLSESKHLRRLVIATSCIGVVALLLALMTQQEGQSADRSAGSLGGAGPLFAVFLTFSLSLSIYEALVRNTGVLRSRSVVLLLTLNVVFLSLSISRASVLNLLIALAVPYIFARKRPTPPLVASILIGFILFAVVINPAITYFRGSAEFYSLGERVERMGDFWTDSISDPASVSLYITAASEKGHYINYFENYYGGLERFAVLPDGDRLINATTVGNQYGSWRTISWALSMIPPRSLYPDKPTMGPGAYLGNVAGLTDVYDKTTHWVVGFPAELYHAFAYRGVFLGTLAILGSFFLVIKVFDLLDVYPGWKMLLVVYYWNTFSEGSLTSIFSSLVPLVILIIALDRAVRYTRRWRFVLR